MRRTASTLVAVLLLAACEGTPDVGLEPSTEEPSPTASAATSPADSEAASASPSPAPAADIDVTTTPDEVTPEWVTAVVNTLLAEYGEMTAEILAMPVQQDPTLPQGFDERLDALFDGEYLDRRRQELQDALTNRDGYRDAVLPSDTFLGLKFVTDVVLYDQATCVIAVGRVDRSSAVPGGTESEILSAISLERGLPAPANQSGWELRDLLPNTSPDGSPNDDEFMLASQLADFGPALENSCQETR